MTPPPSPTNFNSRRKNRAPPSQLRDHFLHKLPKYTGSYSVGYLEVELPVRQPGTTFGIAKHTKSKEEQNSPPLQLQTVLFSIFYPAAVDSPRKKNRKPTAADKGSHGSHGADKQEQQPKLLSRVPWLPRPKVATCKGYAKFLSIPYVPVTAYMALTCMFTTLPAFRNAPLASPPPYLPETTWPEDESRSVAQQAQDGDNDTEETPVHSTPVETDIDARSFPVIIFSHGLGGSRTSCSSVCGELASYGFVVVAMEHRDGSGARTYVNMSKPGEENGEGVRKDGFMIDYIFPEDNAQDTSPNNARGVDMALRTAQISMRLAEIEEAFHVLEMINGGRGHEVSGQNLRQKGNLGSSPYGLDGIDWTEWAGRLHLRNVTMMGHSFGGVTTVQVLRKAERFGFVGQGVLMDAWGPAIPVDDDPVRKPLLSIGSEAFMHWQENFDRIRGICEEARKEAAQTWMLTIRGSTHLSPTDLGLLYPHAMSLFMKNIVNPTRSLRLSVATALEFLKLTGIPEPGAEAWVNEGLLARAERQTFSELPKLHRPATKHIAARLKIENEVYVRLTSWIRRKGAGFRTPPEEGEDGGVVTDEKGRPLGGLMNLSRGSEIWVHLTPSPDEAPPTRVVPAEAD
jgi:platelet-activating factor acetylhydrolase